MIVQVNGISAEIDIAAIDDPRNLALLADVAEGDGVAYIKWYRKLFGVKQSAQLMDAIAEQNGGTLTNEQWDAFVHGAIDAAKAAKGALKN